MSIIISLLHLDYSFTFQWQQWPKLHKTWNAALTQTVFKPWYMQYLLIICFYIASPHGASVFFISQDTPFPLYLDGKLKKKSWWKVLLFPLNMSSLLLPLTFVTILATYLILADPSNFHVKLLLWSLLALITVSHKG